MPTHFRWNSHCGLHMPPISISLLEKLQIKKAHRSSTTNLVNLTVYWEVLIPLYLIVKMKGKKFVGGNTKDMFNAIFHIRKPNLKEYI
ncbi:hypothetical protein Csa_003768 [Cucumis sativus]|nr:hypothetical protein Csa_003768 [Cucumis sativus]